MAKILINDGIHPDGQRLLENAGHEVHTTKIPQDELAAKLPAYDAICVRSATKVRQALIDQCPNLKIIGRGGVGLDNIDVDHAASKGVHVINTPAASSQAVAELAIGQMFSLARFLYDADRKMPVEGDTSFKSLKKSYAKGVELRGKKLGIIGFGRIGQEVARIGLGIGMEVLPVDMAFDEMRIEVDIFRSKNAALSLTLPTVEMKEMLAEADFITIHVPFKTGNKALLGKEEFGIMKEGIRIINTARGGAIDEDALLEALESGKVAAAALDVFENEPSPRKDILTHPRIALSPHIGASTQEAQRKIGLQLATQIIDILEG